jgi:hypothetical protein
MEQISRDQSDMKHIPMYTCSKCYTNCLKESFGLCCDNCFDVSRFINCRGDAYCCEKCEPEIIK